MGTSVKKAVVQDTHRSKAIVEDECTHTHTRTHARTHVRAHTRARARAHIHVHTHARTPLTKCDMTLSVSGDNCVTGTLSVSGDKCGQWPEH